MAYGIKPLSRIQIGKESTAGTAVAATTRLHGTGFIKDLRTLTFPDHPVGHMGGSDSSYIPSVGGEIPRVVEVSFEELPYTLNASIAYQAGTQDGAGSGYVYTYTFPDAADTTIKTYTVEGGDNNEAEEIQYGHVSQFGISGGGGEALQLSETWRGRNVTSTSFTSGLSLIETEKVLFNKGKLFIDAVSGTIGTTQKSNTFMGVQFDCNPMLNPRESGTGAIEFSHLVRGGFEFGVNITFEHDGNATAEKAAWRAETPRLLRLEWLGDALTTAGTYTTKLFRVDLAGKWENFEAIGDDGGTNICTGKFVARYNSTADFYGEIVVVNELSALP